MDHSLAEMTGEHFLVLKEPSTLAAALDKLRDHQCSAAIWLEDGTWKLLTAKVLPRVLLQGNEALQAAARSVAEPLHILPLDSSLQSVQDALKSFGWVALGDQGHIQQLVNWASWARFAARHRLAGPYLFSPETGRNDVPVASH